MSKEPKRNVYVGHRYVPKIMGEWNNQETYEGLSIVTFQGTSYTSKKRVPVGIDILNEEYWVVTGNYNAQIENYRQEVKNVITDLNETKTEINQSIESFKENVGNDLDIIGKDLDSISLNVKKFSIVGDGVTDESLLLNNVIQYAKDNNFSSLLIPNDMNIRAADIQIPDNFILHGGGKLTLSNAGFPVLKVGNNTRIRDISFYSVSDSYTDSKLIQVHGKNNIIEGCKFNEGVNFRSHKGIEILGSAKNTVIKNNYFKDSAFMIYASEGATDIFINGNFFTGGATKGVLRPDGSLEKASVGDAIKTSGGGSGRIIIQGNIFVDVYRDCLDCFTLGEEIIFSNNICIDTHVLIGDIKTIYREGNDPWGTSNPENPTKRISFYNNFIKGKTIGTYDQKLFNIANINHREDEIYEDVRYGVYDIQIENNYIDVEAKHVIYIGRSYNITVKNNIIKGLFERGVWVRQGSEHVSIESNEIYIGQTITPVFGIYTDNLNKGKISNNNVIGDDESKTYIYPYTIYNCSELQITGNKANTGEVCMEVVNTSNSSFTNNHLKGARVSLIRFIDGSLSIISNNSMFDCQRGIQFNGNPNKIIASFNSMIDCVSPFSNGDIVTESNLENNSFVGHYEG